MTRADLRAMRTEYARLGFTESQAGDDPLALFERWLADAIAGGLEEANAMALATATADGQPSVRIVLLKQLDASGAVFHTNYASRKGAEIEANPHAAGVLLWHPLQRQVRIEGPIARVSAEESDAYFATRPPGGRVSAIASPQSQVVADRAELERRFAAASEDAGTVPVPRPEHWGGYRILVASMEFWQGRENRLHDRIRFTRDGDSWRRERLAP